MFDTTKAKADAEEGLRIAEKATEGPWNKSDCVSPKIVVYAVPAKERQSVDPLYLGETYCDQKGQGRANLTFVVDSRTRAPNAYRNVIALAEENDRLVSERDEAVSEREHAESCLSDANVELRMEHKRLVATEVECDKLRAELAQCGERELNDLRIGSQRLSDLIAMQEKVTALEAEVERMKPLIAATFAWVETEGIAGDNALLDAVNSYEASPTP